MLEHSKEIEKNLMDIYTEIKEQYPDLHHLSFEITTYDSGKTRLYGYIHIGGDCKIYDDIAKLSVLVSETKERRLKKLILFQKFEGIL